MDEKESKAKASFPGISEKLAAPVRQSAFERSKAEAEAKRRRNEAETAAVLEEFKKDFGDDEGGNPSTPRTTGPPNFAPRTGSGFQPPRRHFAANSLSAGAMKKSGPGTLDHLGTPGSFNKRNLHFQKATEPKSEPRPRTQPRTGGASGSGSGGIFGDDDDDDEVDDPFVTQRASGHGQDKRAAERVVAKPTLRLASLPPTTSQAVINNLFARTNLKVDSIRTVQSASSQPRNSTDRKSMTAIVSFGSETPASELDKAVTQLRGTYLGWGYKLSIQRHLSSAVLDSATADASSLFSSLALHPFGAKPVRNEAPAPRGPPSHGHRNSRFAPPASYDSPYGQPTERLEVTVNPPSDINQIRLIHKTIEGIEKHGIDYEALLMSRHAVQRDEKFAWLFNHRSPEGVYYIFKLREILGICKNTHEAPQQDYGVGRQRAPVRMFLGNPEWRMPEEPLPYEFQYAFRDLVTDPSYDSSEEEDSGDENGMPRNRRNRRDQGRQVTDITALENIGEEPSFLNPFQRAKLIHLLSRLPPTQARLRLGDVARVSAFAITHAGMGADEVVHILIYNVTNPFCLMKLGNVGPVDDPDDGGDRMEVDGGGEEDRQEDKSGAVMVGLFIISDLLLSSSTSGMPRAWRYRTMLQTALQRYGIFGQLGRLPRDLEWGRIRSEKWHRSVMYVLTVWAERNVFSREDQDVFKKEFENPPLTEAEKEAKLKEEQAKEEAERAKKRQKKLEDKARREKQGSGWKEQKGTTIGLPTVEATSEVGGETDKGKGVDRGGSDVKEGDIQMATDASTGANHGKAGGDGGSGDTPVGSSRAARRPKAEDMFEDSE